MGLARKLPIRRSRAVHSFRPVGVVSALVAAAFTLSETRTDASPFAPFAGVEAWVARIQQPDARVRRVTAWSVAQRAREESPRGPIAAAATSALVTQLAREDDPASARLMLSALGSVATPEAAEALRSYATVRDQARPALQVTALRTLAGGQASRQQLGPLLLLTSTITGAGAGSAISDVAVRTLAELPHELFATALGMAQQQMSAGLPGMVRAIGVRGDPRWAGVVLEALRPARAQRPALVFAALDASARMQLAEASGLVLARATAEGDLALRRAAVIALASLAGSFDPSALRPLLADPSLREPALDTLATIGDRASVSAIVSLLDASWPGDRRAAAEALADIGDQAALDPLIAHARSEAAVDTRRTLWRSVARIGGPVARAALLASNDPLARWALAELFHRESMPQRGVVTDARGVPEVGAARSADVARVTALESALAREDREGTRVALVLALSAIARGEDGRAAGASCDALVDLVTREQASPSVAAAAALSELGELRVAAARQVALTIAASDVRDPLARQAAVFALGRIGGRGGALLAERALFTDSDERVQGAAAVSLAALLGSSARDALNRASWAAGSSELIERYRWAMSAAGSPRGRGAESVRAGGAPPGSVWALSLADGRLAWGVAAEDGELWITGCSAVDEGDLFRVR